MKECPTQPWLTTAEQEEVIENLINFNCELIKWDNARKLPLKKGGFTDIYINLRNARNNPEAIAYIAKIYRNPLLRLEAQRFVEVPDSVSCFAGHLSVLTGIPYVTIREQAKEGRVSKAKVIGNPKPGEIAPIIDDVITDGGSKIIPVKECLEMRLNVPPLVVLVDRQQGWKTNFLINGVNVGVWPGMTLHDVRKFLISRGYMKRCGKDTEEKNPLVIAWDNTSWEEMISPLDELRAAGCIHKVNDALFENGMGIVSDLNVYGRVLADLKSHDIPQTVFNTCKRLRKYCPWGVTVHASGQKEMIKAAVEALKGTNIKIFTVTALTSLGEQGCFQIFSREAKAAAAMLTEIAKESGATGIVCSAKEIETVKNVWPNAELLVPALRFEEKEIANDDQKRTDTPKAAKGAGADYLVIGRQIMRNSSPAKEAGRVLEHLGITQ